MMLLTRIRTMAETCLLDSVKKYYTDWSQSCTGFSPSIGEGLAVQIKEGLAAIHEDILKRFYGCGIVIPEKMQGMKVLDIGCGAGRDTYIISKLIGPNGKVTGVDMTEDLIEVANKHVNYHMEKFGFPKPNIDFFVGYIEKLGEKGIKDNAYDILVSNGVINLTADKTAVLKEAYRVLKEGGELYFSDVYCSKELSDVIRKNEFLWGNCIAGALYWKSLYDIAADIGFSAPRLVEIGTIPIKNEEYRKLLADARFVSTTFRLFKLPKARRGPTAVVYKGGIVGYEKELKIDVRNIFKVNESRTVDSDLATFLASSRFKNDFDFHDPVVSSPFDYLDELEARGQTPDPAFCVE